MTSPVPTPAGEDAGSADLRSAMKTFRFGPFVLSVERFELSRDGVPVELPAGPFEILVLLLRQRHGVVTRAEIARAIWPESNPGDVTHRINTAINRIRAALGDNPAEPVYIQTVIGRGYRFVGTLEADAAATGAPLVSDAPAVMAEEVPAGGVVRAAATRRRLWLVAAAAVVVVAIAAVGFLVARRRSEPQVGVPGFQATQVTFNQSENRVTAAAISPDGQRIAYADADGVRLMALSQMDSTPVPTPEHCVISHVAWYPDGRHLLISGVVGSSDESDAWLLSLDGAAPRLLQKDAWRAVPSPNGAAIAYSDATHAEIWVLEKDGAAPRRVLTSAEGMTFRVSAWAPNGRTLLVERFRGHAADIMARPGTENDPRFSLVALDTKSGQITASRDGFRMDDAVISPAGVLLFSRLQPGGLGLWTASLQPETGAIAGAPKLGRVTSKDVQSFSMSLHGAIAMLVQTKIPGAVLADFQLSPPAIRDATPLSSSSKGVYPHSWSLNSNEVYFEQQRDAGTYRIFRQAIGEHDAVALAQTPDSQAFPLVTPDGRWVLFKGRNSVHEPWVWYRVPVLGGSTERLPLRGPAGEVRCPVVGTRCLISQRDVSGNILLYGLDPVAGLGELVWTIGQRGDTGAVWDVSPSGEQLAVLGANLQHPALQVITLSAEVAQQAIPINVHEPVVTVHWAAKGRGWFITTRTATGSDIFFLESGGRITLLRTTSGRSWADPSPDGSKLVFVDQRDESNVWLLSEPLEKLKSGH